MLGGIINYLPVPLQEPIFKSSYYLIAKIFYHFSSKAKKNIYLFSTRRGGSTLLGQMISANEGIRFIDQPLTAYAPHGVAGGLRKRVTEKYLPQKKYSQYTSLSGEDKGRLVEYIALLSDGKVSLNIWLEYKASQKKMFFYTDRVMLKLTGANAIIDWISGSFDCHVVYLIRHPVANALSIIKNNWTITASAYLEDKHFCEKYLSDEQITLGRDILESSDYFQQAILNWCLENLVPLNYSKQGFLMLTYEELVMCPEQVIDLLSKRFNLKDKNRMRHISTMPSYSSSLSENSTVKSIKKETGQEGRYENIINRWRDKVSMMESEKAENILKVFNLNVYSCDSSIPGKEYLHFPSCFMDKVS